MPKKTGLGRGLGSLLGEEAVAAADAVVSEKRPDEERLSTARVLKISEVVPNPEQPRRVFDEKALEALASSVKKYGVLQPISVRWSAKNRIYIIVAGERRWRASRMAGLTTIPAVIAGISEQDAYELSLIENLMREDLNPIEEALGYRTLTDKYKLSEQEVGERLGRDRTTITNSIRLLSLSAPVLEWLETGALSRGHARALVTLPHELQENVAETVVRDALSVREAEELVRKQTVDSEAPRKREKPVAGRSAVNYAKDLSRQLEKAMARRVRIKLDGRGDRGWLSVQFEGLDDLDKITKTLNKAGAD